jgi:DNA-binding transcriptional LysR family regulator
VAELERLDTVNMSTVGDTATWQLVGPDGATHAFQHRPRYVADDLLTLKFAVLGGTGICALPDYLCSEELRDGRLVNVLPGWAPKPGVFHAVFPSRRGLVPAVRRFLDFLAEAIEREGQAQLPAG